MRIIGASWLSTIDEAIPIVINTVRTGSSPALRPRTDETAKERNVATCEGIALFVKTHIWGVNGTLTSAFWIGVATEA